MKTDYAKLGEIALARLRRTVQMPITIQTQMLADLMSKNCHTAYGRKYEFHKIHTVEEFQKKVPISTYKDYEPYILQIIDGKEHVLTEDAAICFCISGGTTGKPRYLPLMEPDLMIQYLYAYGAVFGTVREFYRNIPESSIFGKILQVDEFTRNYMGNRRMGGTRLGCLYQWLDWEGEFDTSDYCVPKEVLFPNKQEDLTYVKVRFALAERKIMAIRGVFASQVVEVMHYIYHNWDMLLKDMECGSVDESVELSEDWKQFVRVRLPPDSVRARELRSLSHRVLSHNMIKKIWPDIRYILAIGGRTFSGYTEELKEYAGNIPIHYFVYAASEGILGIAGKMNDPDAYILFPEAGIFEFLPLMDEGRDSSHKIPYLMWELRCGEQYEVLFTNHSGLYRYRIGDVIEVVDWYGQVPVVKFSRRKNQDCHDVCSTQKRRFFSLYDFHFARK